MKMRVILVLGASVFRWSLTERLWDATEIFVGLYQTTRRHLPRAVRNHRPENPKSIYRFLDWPVFLSIPS